MKIRSRFACVLLSLSTTTVLFAQRPEDKPLSPVAQVPVAFNFEFGPAKPGTTAMAVADYDAYAVEKGYGFDLGTKPGTDTPFFFSVKVPEGNYRVTVTLGDPAGETDTTIRSESGHIHLVDVKTAAGRFTTKTFYANVRRPEISPPAPSNAPGEPRVHMFLRGEAEARCWDEKLTIEFNGARPRVAALEIVRDTQVPTVFMAGDSTVA
jgi:hypothetical protein